MEMHAGKRSKPCKAYGITANSIMKVCNAKVVAAARHAARSFDLKHSAAHCHHQRLASTQKSKVRNKACSLERTSSSNREQYGITHRKEARSGCLD
eukprot:6192297-Pleurochrysis_carterae.AAC.2